MCLGAMYTFVSSSGFEQVISFIRVSFSVKWETVDAYITGLLEGLNKTEQKKT